MATALAAAMAPTLAGSVSSLGAAALPAIGNVVGGLLSGFNRSSGGGLDIKGNMALMRYQTNLQKEMTQWTNENQYKFMRTGLENADYNPLLAVGATPSQGNVGLATGQSNSASMGIDLNSVASILNTTANTRLQEQQAETEFSKRVNLSADTGLKLADTMYKKGLIKWQDLQNYAEVALKRSASAMNSASAKSISLDNPGKERYNRWLEEHPHLSGMKYYNESLGPAVTGAAGFAIGRGIPIPHRKVGF